MEAGIRDEGQGTTDGKPGPLVLVPYPLSLVTAVLFPPPRLVRPPRLDPDSPRRYPKSLAQKRPSADVAQLVEHLICNQAVASSTLAVSSAGVLMGARARDPRVEWVGFPSGQRDQTVNLTAHAFEGSNPSPTIWCEVYRRDVRE